MDLCPLSSSLLGDKSLCTFAVNRDGKSITMYDFVASVHRRAGFFKAFRDSTCCLQSVDANLDALECLVACLSTGVKVELTTVFPEAEEASAFGVVVVAAASAEESDVHHSMNVVSMKDASGETDGCCCCTSIDGLMSLSVVFKDHDCVCSVIQLLESCLVDKLQGEEIISLTYSSLASPVAVALLTQKVFATLACVFSYAHCGIGHVVSERLPRTQLYPSRFFLCDPDDDLVSLMEKSRCPLVPIHVNRTATTMIHVNTSLGRKHILASCIAAVGSVSFRDVTIVSDGTKDEHFVVQCQWNSQEMAKVTTCDNVIAYAKLCTLPFELAHVPSWCLVEQQSLTKTTAHSLSSSCLDDCVEISHAKNFLRARLRKRCTNVVHTLEDFLTAPSPMLSELESQFVPSSVECVCLCGNVEEISRVYVRRPVAADCKFDVVAINANVEVVCVLQGVLFKNVGRDLQLYCQYWIKHSSFHGLWLDGLHVYASPLSMVFSSVLTLTKHYFVDDSSLVDRQLLHEVVVDTATFSVDEIVNLLSRANSLCKFVFVTHEHNKDVMAFIWRTCMDHFGRCRCVHIDHAYHLDHLDLAKRLLSRESCGPIERLVEGTLSVASVSKSWRRENSNKCKYACVGAKENVFLWLSNTLDVQAFHVLEDIRQRLVEFDVVLWCNFANQRDQVKNFATDFSSCGIVLLSAAEWEYSHYCSEAGISCIIYEQVLDESVLAMLSSIAKSRRTYWSVPNQLISRMFHTAFGNTLSSSTLFSMNQIRFAVGVYSYGAVLQSAQLLDRVADCVTNLWNCVVLIAGSSVETMRVLSEALHVECVKVERDQIIQSSIECLMRGRPSCMVVMESNLSASVLSLVPQNQNVEVEASLTFPVKLQNVALLNAKGHVDRLDGVTILSGFTGGLVGIVNILDSFTFARVPKMDPAAQTAWVEQNLVFPFEDIELERFPIRGCSVLSEILVVVESHQKATTSVKCFPVTLSDDRSSLLQRVVTCASSFALPIFKANRGLVVCGQSRRQVHDSLKWDVSPLSKDETLWLSFSPVEVSRSDASRLLKWSSSPRYEMLIPLCQGKACTLMVFQVCMFEWIRSFVHLPQVNILSMGMASRCAVAACLVGCNPIFDAVAASFSRDDEVIRKERLVECFSPFSKVALEFADVPVVMTGPSSFVFSMRSKLGTANMRTKVTQDVLLWTPEHADAPVKGVLPPEVNLVDLGIGQRISQVHQLWHSSLEKKWVNVTGLVLELCPLSSRSLGLVLKRAAGVQCMCIFGRQGDDIQVESLAKLLKKR